MKIRRLTVYFEFASVGFIIEHSFYIVHILFILQMHFEHIPTRLKEPKSSVIQKNVLLSPKNLYLKSMTDKAENFSKRLR